MNSPQRTLRTQRKEPEYIRFIEGVFPKSGKTKRWHVENRRHGSLLGVIVWNGGWRQYVFAPMNDALFSAGCLRDIADFLEEQTRAYRSAASASSAVKAGAA